MVVDKREAKTGNIIAALIDRETTLKRLVEKNGQYYLQAANPAYEDLLPLGSLEIQGVVIGHIRQIK